MNKWEVLRRAVFVASFALFLIFFFPIMALVMMPEIGFIWIVLITVVWAIFVESIGTTFGSLWQYVVFAYLTTCGLWSFYALPQMYRVRDEFWT
ncbi:MAG: hypothetical protein KW806_00500 [Candidatus Yanofskybacteria bacterium]|nr:hypothetical protein [Candidatus Yanofskybacteria bacterium]